MYACSTQRKNIAYTPRDPTKTLLYKTVAENIETFFAQADADPYAKGWPEYVKKEFYDFLRCGVLAYGFNRLHCSDCKKDLLVGFSCKNRGFCPSCAGRRMVEAAAHLTDYVLPHENIRQWVATLPHPLRYWCAGSKLLTTKVHKIIANTVSQFLVSQAVALGHPRNKLHAGSATFIQRFGSSLNLNLHFHMLFVEGVWLETENKKPKFIKLEPPTDDQILLVVTRISRRIIRMLRKEGYLDTNTIEVISTNHDPLFEEEPEHARSIAASIKHMIAFGPRAGQKVRTLKATAFGCEGQKAELVKQRCAKIHGFSLHADVRIKANRRDKLEKLVRYTARGAFSHKRLTQDKHGDLLYELKTSWSDGTTHIRLSPMELMEKLAALIPLPRFNLFRYSGVLAPNSKLRKHVIPNPEVSAPESMASEDESELPAAKYSWSQLMKRSFGIDMNKCPSCKSANFKVVAVIEDPEVIQRILNHVGLEARAPPLSAPRIQPELEYDEYLS